MDACLRLIDSEGIAAVSLRRVAREAGVSPAAPYHHFADRSALLAALSTRGFGLLSERLIAARESAGDAAGALVALVHAYIDFARTEPGLFRLMFRPELSQPHKNVDARAAGDAAYAVPSEVVAECVEAGIIAPEDAEAVMLAVWGLGHGIASLWVDGQLDDPDRLRSGPADVTARVMRLLGSAVSACGPQAETT